MDLLVWSALLDRLARHIGPFDGKPHVGLFETCRANLLQPHATSETFETLLSSVDSFVQSKPLLYDGQPAAEAGGPPFNTSFGLVLSGMRQ